MSTTKRIIYIVSQFPEIHETFIVREIRAIVARGFEIEIASLKRQRDPFVYSNALPLLALTVYPAWKIRFLSGLTLLYFVLRQPWRFATGIFLLIKDNSRSLLYLLKCLVVVPRSTYLAWRACRRKYELLHAHWATIPATVAWFAARLSGAPYLLTAHAWDIYVHPGNLLRVLNDATAVVTCTHYNREFLHAKFVGKIHTPIQVIYHGLELEQFQRQQEIKNPVFTILAVGRLVPQKGFDVLLAACQLLRADNLEFRCVIIGTGPLLPQLQNQIDRLKLRDQIEMLGALPHEQVLSWMNRTQVMAVPSVIAANQDRDGIPNVLIEAMALHLPVIATKVSGIPEVVHDLVTGILIEPNQPRALAAAITHLYHHPELREALAQQGRLLVEEQFDIHKNIERVAQIYHEIER